MSMREEILELVETSGQNATVMTQALKNIGGDMHNGIKEVSRFFFDEGIDVGISKGKGQGRMEGALGTTIIFALIGTGCYVYNRLQMRKAQKAHLEDGERIVSGFRSALEAEPNDFQSENCTEVPNPTVQQEEVEE